jgi:probable phosphoglycerate mutase
MPTVLLARHGETDWNREGRIQGWAPTALNDRGHAQASALGMHLATTVDDGIDRLYASDLRRTRQTAAHLAEPLGLEPVHESAWRERDFGVLQGLLADELSDEYPEYSLDLAGEPAADERPDSGESFLDVRERVLDRYRSLRADLAPDETALVVAHGGSIKLLLGAIRDQTARKAIIDQPMGNCGLSRIDIDPERDAGNGQGTTAGAATADEVVTANRTGFLTGTPERDGSVTR